MHRESAASLASRGINLSKIESRPTRKKAWSYLFFIDFMGHYEDAEAQAALNELEAHCDLVKWLGSYPNVHREAEWLYRVRNIMSRSLTAAVF